MDVRRLVRNGFAHRWVAPALVWVIASAALWAALAWLQWRDTGVLVDGFRLREESSDTAWQTIRLWELWKVGPQALWLMHIYPPLYDAIRFVLMQPEVSAGLSPNAIAVDERLTVMNIVLFGLVATVVYLWVRDLTRSGWWALGGAALWCVVPASSAFMTLFNQTGLAIASMAVAFYLLYRFCRTRRGAYSAGFLLALLVASLTRNVVQVHVLVVIVVAAFAFAWMSRSRRLLVLAVNLVLVGLIAFWPVRAYVMYATFDVSTHTGYNRAGALWINPADVPAPAEWPANLEANATRLSSGWNTQETLKDNYRLGQAANDLMLHHPVEALGRMVDSATVTLPVMFRSVFVQWYNALLVAVPAAKPLDWLFSGWRFATMILASIAVVFAAMGRRAWPGWLRRYGWFVAFWVLTLIPVVLSNRYWPVDIAEPTHSEADRLRALVDVPVYVVMTYAAWVVAQRVRGRLRRRRRNG